MALRFPLGSSSAARPGRQDTAARFRRYRGLAILELHPMSPSNRVVSLIQSRAKELGVRWINTGRISEDWKAKIFESANGPSQFAIYNTKSVIQILLEREIDPVPGTRLHNKTRPKSDALNDPHSHFSSVRGVCYQADSESSFLALIS